MNFQTRQHRVLISNEMKTKSKSKIKNQQLKLKQIGNLQSAIGNGLLPPVNQQALDIRPTPREEMQLYSLDTFPYEYAGREIKINFEIPEFTAICPFSDFPDFATIKLEYVPNERCIELKSLKMYINSFREIKIFHEHVVNVIMEDFVKACDPLSVELEGNFNVRGNIKTVVKASYKKQSEQ